MSYKKLKSLYYENEDKYKSEYEKRFNDENTVKLNFYIGENKAFFCRNYDVMSRFFEIAKLDKKIGKLCDELPKTAITQYSKKCLIDEIVLTNNIEGVHSSRKELNDVLEVLEAQSENKHKQKRFFGIVNKYYKLINNENIRFENCSDVRRLYDEIFLDEIIFEDIQNKPDGVYFRKEAVSIYSGTQKVIHSGVSPESKIIEYMTNALNFLNNGNVENILKICIFHYMFEYIHPFYDGNGRMGRFILSYGISKELTPLLSFRISQTIKENINLYYKSFEICNDEKNKGDLTPFLLSMSDIILSALKECEIILTEKLSVYENYKNKIKDKYNDDFLILFYSVLLQASLFGEIGISTGDLCKCLNCSEYILKKTVEGVPSENIIINKSGNRKYYSLNIDILL